jgi:hypothetical protein
LPLPGIRTNEYPAERELDWAKKDYYMLYTVLKHKHQVKSQDLKVIQPGRGRQNGDDVIARDATGIPEASISESESRWRFAAEIAAAELGRWRWKGEHVDRKP